MKKKSKKGASDKSRLNNAPKSNRELALEAKEANLKAPKVKFKCSVYYDNERKKQMEIQTVSICKMIKAQKRFSKHITAHVVRYSEIKPIK